MSTLNSIDLNIVRSTSRVIAPPGGKSSFSIGGDWNNEEPVKVNRYARGQEVPVTGRITEQHISPKKAPTTLMDMKMKRDENDRDFAAPVAQQAIPNTRETAPPVTGAKPSTRVAAPPGGASSFTLY